MSQLIEEPAKYKQHKFSRDAAQMNAYFYTH
jgi:hypothetical protein